MRRLRPQEFNEHSASEANDLAPTGLLPSQSLLRASLGKHGVTQVERISLWYAHCDLRRLSWKDTSRTTVLAIASENVGLLACRSLGLAAARRNLRLQWTKKGYRIEAIRPGGASGQKIRRVRMESCGLARSW